MTASGRILVESAYAQGKMLNHSSWRGLLPRSITPSDIDMVFENNSNFSMILVEFSSRFKMWSQLQKAQVDVYKTAIAAGNAVAVLARHDVPAERQIDSLRDVLEFNVMSANPGTREFYYSGPLPGERWENFVVSFYKDFGKFRGHVARLSALEEVA